MKRRHLLAFLRRQCPQLFIVAPSFRKPQAVQYSTVLYWYRYRRGDRALGAGGGHGPGRVRWTWRRPLLSRPRGAFGSWAAALAAAVEPAADSVVARSCGYVLVGLDGCEVRLCVSDPSVCL